MPKAAVYEYRQLAVPDHNVWVARDSSTMEAIPNASS